MKRSERKVKEATGYKSSKVMEEQISELECQIKTLSEEIAHFEAFAGRFLGELYGLETTLEIEINDDETYSTLPRALFEIKHRKKVGFIKRLFTGKQYEPISPDVWKQFVPVIKESKVPALSNRINSLKNKVTVFGKKSVTLGEVKNTIYRSKQRIGQLTIKLDRIRADLNFVRTTEEVVWAEEEKQLRIKLKREEEVKKLRARVDATSRRTRQIASYVRTQLRPQLAIMGVCPYCGNPLDGNPHADHIYPISRGGLSIISNMIIICSECNIKKSDLTLNEFIERHGFDRVFVEGNLKKLGKRF
jgi:5-methylcytosine-specific restriction endonuclease McrA